MRKVVGLVSAVVVATGLAGSASAQNGAEPPKQAPAAAVKGAVTLWDGRSATIKLDDGTDFIAAISAERTQVTVAGQKTGRDSIMTGMRCTIDGPKGGEAKSISCN